MKPQVVTHELDKLLDDDAIVITTAAPSPAGPRVTSSCAEQMYFAVRARSRPWPTACLMRSRAAVALSPSARSSRSLATAAVAMLMGDLVTLRKYGLDNVKLIVIKNDTLGQIKWEQMVFLGNPEFGCELEPIDFAAVARGCGLEAVTIEDPATCGDRLREAMQANGPFLVEAVVDPNEPPLPPKVAPDQAIHLAEALAKGTSGAGKIAKTIAKDVVRELV